MKSKNETKFDNYKKRKILRIFTIIFALLTIVLSILSLVIKLNVIYALLSLVICTMFAKIRDNIKL